MTASGGGSSMNYQQQTLAVMNSLDLVVALYDGMIRFLHRAIENVETGDVAGRRDAIRRVLDILTYLQARLRTDVGGQPAAALSEFYAAIYAQCVRGSRDASIPLLQQSIRDILNVRDAWKQVALPNGQVNLPQRTSELAHPSFPNAGSCPDNAGIPAFLSADAESHRWLA
jgi:flagellar secretion chaperone FliS